MKLFREPHTQDEVMFPILAEQGCGWIAYLSGQAVQLPCPLQFQDLQIHPGLGLSYQK